MQTFMDKKMSPGVPRGMMGYPVELLEDPAAAWRTAAALDSPSPRSLYVHIPYCRSRCLFCPFYLGAAERSEIDEYVRLLKHELETWAEAAGRFPVNSVYFGGGSPSELDGGELVSILETVRRNYRLAADCEITIEGRIDDLTPDKVRRFADAGVNRLSIGIQTFDTQLRRSLGRRSDRAAILARLGELSRLNELAVVIDLLYGLPGETLEMWERDLDTLFSETRISGLDLYRLRVGEGLPLAAAIAAGKLPPVPPDEAVYGMFLAGVARMKAEGAVRLSPVHFAFEPRERNLHNTVSSSKHACLPFGMKAGGRIAGYRFIQQVDFGKYREMVTAGEKPVVRAGKLPPDFPVCGVLAGQVYRQMRIYPVRVAAAAPEKFRDGVARNLERGILEWIGRGFLTAGECGGFALTEKANYSHRAMASDLMEKIAEAFE